MIDVVETQVLTYKVLRSNGTEAMVVASDDKKTLEINGKSADRKVYIKNNDMNSEMTKDAIVSCI